MTLTCSKCKRSIQLSHAEVVRLEAGILQSNCLGCGEAYSYPISSTEDHLKEGE